MKIVKGGKLELFTLWSRPVKNRANFLSFWNDNLYFFRLFMLRRLPEPGRFITHIHFSVLNQRPVNPEISASLHPYSGSVLAVV
jgi:hypothetical protein